MFGNSNDKRDLMNLMRLHQQSQVDAIQKLYYTQQYKTLIKELAIADLDKSLFLLNLHNDMLRTLPKTGNIKIQLGIFKETFNQDSQTLMRLSAHMLNFITTTNNNMTEISKAVEHQTEAIGTISSFSANMSSQFSENYDTMLEIKDENEKIADLMTSVESNTNNLRKLIHQINSIVDSVNVIAEQTNLLALNASIEAARAGEAGRGFAVVADEIRKLAENTKVELVNINKFTQEIEAEADKSAESVGVTKKAMTNVTLRYNEISETFKEFNTMSAEISKRVDSLSAFMEELMASTEEITSSIAAMVEESEQIVAIAKLLSNYAKASEQMYAGLGEAEEGFFAISQTVCHILHEHKIVFPNEEFIKHIDIAITGHQKWMTHLKEIVDNACIRVIQADGSRCAFGLFYNNIKVMNPKIVKVWNEIDKPHKSLHAIGGKIIDSISQNKANRFEIEKLYKDAVHISEEVIEKLGQIKQTILEFKDGETVISQ